MLTSFERSSNIGYKLLEREMTEKFKYGPLIWNYIDEEDDSGNYWWTGTALVGYDKDNIPIDAKGLQCLTMSSPVHPKYQLKHSVFSSIIKDHLPSIDEWRQWFDEQFIEIDDARIKREILRWYVKTQNVTPAFISLYSKCETLQEMVMLIWPQDENK
jgi:hypothetical protein